MRGSYKQLEFNPAFRFEEQNPTKPKSPLLPIHVVVCPKLFTFSFSRHTPELLSCYQALGFFISGFQREQEQLSPLPKTNNFPVEKFCGFADWQENTFCCRPQTQFQNLENTSLKFKLTESGKSGEELCPRTRIDTLLFHDYCTHSCGNGLSWNQLLHINDKTPLW